MKCDINQNTSSAAAWWLSFKEYRQDIQLLSKGHKTGALQHPAPDRVLTHYLPCIKKSKKGRTKTIRRNDITSLDERVSCEVIPTNCLSCTPSVVTRQLRRLSRLLFFSLFTGRKKKKSTGPENHRVRSPTDCHLQNQIDTYNTLEEKFERPPNQKCYTDRHLHWTKNYKLYSTIWRKKNRRKEKEEQWKWYIFLVALLVISIDMGFRWRNLWFTYQWHEIPAWHQITTELAFVTHIDEHTLARTIRIICPSPYVNCLQGSKFSLMVQIIHKHWKKLNITMIFLRKILWFSSYKPKSRLCN